MKNLLLIAAIMIGASHSTVSNPTYKELPSGYFMIIAAYAPSAESYATKFVDALKEKGINADYGYSYSKELFFVYSSKYNSRAKAISSIIFERERTGENKAWVYVYKSANGIETVDTPPDNEPGKEVVEAAEMEPQEEAIKEDSTNTIEIKEEVAETPISHKGITYLHIEATDAASGNPIKIEYEIIDLARNTLITTAESQASFALKEPNSASKMIQVQSNDVGWQKQSFDFKYYEPIIDPISIFLDNLGDTTFVKFEMNPLKKGDLVTLYKVFFFKDAGIMMDKSIYELDQVVALMENNSDMGIIIHGHTNGKSAGKIIALKDEHDIDFFNINGDHRELAGSAVELSAERASVVGRYLENKGISSSRIEIKGWGGKKMLYDKHSKEARYNVRVEIEVVDK